MEQFTKPAIVVGPVTMDRYLATILALSRRAPVVRSVDVAAYIGCSKACVSVAVKQMIRDALIVRDGRGPLVLSEAGKYRAAPYLERFEFFYSLLTDAGVDVGSAKDEADAIAAALSAHSFEILKRKQEKKHDRSDSPRESVEK